MKNDRVSIATIMSVLLLVGCSGQSALQRALSRIEPGMGSAQVARIIPRSFVIIEGQINPGTPVGTFLVASNAHCVTRSCYADRSLLIADDYAEIYFDEFNAVVGIRYSSSSLSWKPKWGYEIKSKYSRSSH